MLVAVLAATLVLRAGPPSEICDIGSVPKLAPGSYTGRFVQVGTAKGGADVANMQVQVLVRGELVLHVDDDGVITAASAPRAQWVLIGAGTIESGEVPIISELKGFAEGALTMIGPGGDQAVTLGGDVEGSAKAFTQIGRDKMAWPGPAVGELTVELRVTYAGCSRRNTGEMRSKVVDETLAALAARKFSTEAAVGSFQLQGPPELAEREQELQKRMEQAKQWTRGGGEDPRGARGWPLFAAAAESILRERSEAARYCLRLQYHPPAYAALDARLAAIRGELDALDASPRNLGLIRMGVDDLMELDRHVVELKLDSCSQKLHQQIFDAAVAKLGAVIDRAVKERTSTGDLSEILRRASVTGKVAPGLRDRAVAQLRQRAARAKGGG